MFHELPPLLLPGGGWGGMELIRYPDWWWRQGLRHRITAISSTCREMQCFTVALQGERYNLVPGSGTDRGPARRARWAKRPLVHRYRSDRLKTGWIRGRRSRRT